MWKFVALVMPVVVGICTSFVVVPQDELIDSFKGTRALLTPEQEEFLMELLAADDALIEAKSRGIVDDILQALSGTGGGAIRVNIIGGGTPQNPQPAPGSVGSATLTLSGNPMLTLQSASDLQKALINSSDSTASGSAPVTGAPIPGFPLPVQGSQQQGQQSQGGSNITAIGGNNNHLLSTISSVITNSNRRNVTGIVDDSLRIATPAPIREFVTGILNVVYCNSIRRLLGRC